MAQIVNKIFARFEWYCYCPKLNIFKTIYFNFRTLSFKEAVKFPVYVYSGVRLANLSGKVVFRNCKLRRGMVQLGKCVDLFYPKGRSLFVLSRDSQLIFEGDFFINPRFTIRVVGAGILAFGANVRVGSNVRICCQESISIGGNTGITYNCEIMDSNFHYIMNQVDYTVKRYTSPIQIGLSNWIGNNTQIMKGTRTQDNTMVGARSLLNKDYVSMYPDEEYVTLAGVPAKLKGVGHQRVFSKYVQVKLERFFMEHPGVRTVTLSDEDKDGISRL